MSNPDKPGQRLSQAAGEVARLRRAIAADSRLRTWSGALKQWQAGRLAQTHADLIGEPRTRAAAQFFLDDLYGAKDFSRRDAELIRLLPTMTRLLPDRALATLADAVELDALSERLDEAMARHLHAEVAGQIDEATYASAFRATAARELRLHQLDLVMHIGRSLESLVRHPMLGRLLAAMAGPAKLAGLHEMHDFLSRGFGAFKGMPASARFLERIDQRERSIMNQLFEGADRGWTSGRETG